MRSSIWISLAALTACSTADEPGTASVDQAATPVAREVMKDADTATKYAKACGLGDTPDVSLPELGTASDPIRGTTDATQVGKLESNGWTLIQNFKSDSRCLASAETLKANLWHKQKGGRDWYYLYRYADPDPMVNQDTLNGILGFDDTSICAFDRIGKALPPKDMTDLYFAGEIDNDDSKMDDCSNCHVHGYNAPRPKTLAVARGNKGKKFPWLKVVWPDKWKKFAKAYGPIWKLGKETTTDKWVSGSGTALVTPPKECKTCHGDNWIPAQKRNPGSYCESVLETAFDRDGSMTHEGNKFEDPTTCQKFLDDIGCGTGRPGMGADLGATLCTEAAVTAAPLVNDVRVAIESIQPVDGTTVNVYPVHNGVLWDFGTTWGVGDPWVGSLQVWGGPYPDSMTSPLSSEFPAGSDGELPSSIQVSDLTPGTTYQFQLKITDQDGEKSFGPLMNFSMPGACGGGSDSGGFTPACYQIGL